MKKRWFSMILAFLVIIFLTSCGVAKPPISLAPTGEILKEALILQLELSQKEVSQQLEATNPISEISGVVVKNIEGLYMGHLPTFHLQGTYNLELALDDRKETQKGNVFDIYIQRQKEGKTWRWLKREIPNPEAQPIWTTYLVK